MILLGILAGLCDTIPVCSAQTQSIQSSPRAQTLPVTGNTWTLAFYFAGENSLENDCVDNLKEICEGGPALTDANIVVFFARDFPGAWVNVLPEILE